MEKNITFWVTSEWEVKVVNGVEKSVKTDVRRISIDVRDKIDALKPLQWEEPSTKEKREAWSNSAPSASEITVWQGLLGQITYIAEWSPASSFPKKYYTSGIKEDMPRRIWLQINCVVSHLKENASIFWTIRELKEVGAFFEVTDFAHQRTFAEKFIEDSGKAARDGKGEIVGRRGFGAGVLGLGDVSDFEEEFNINTICWPTYQLQRRTWSSYAGEVITARIAKQKMQVIKTFLAWILRSRPRTVNVLDNDGMSRAITNTSGGDDAPECRNSLNQLRSDFMKGRMTLTHIGDKSMVADGLTKDPCERKIEQLKDLFRNNKFKIREYDEMKPVSRKPVKGVTFAKDDLKTVLDHESTELCEYRSMVCLSETGFDVENDSEGETVEEDYIGFCAPESIGKPMQIEILG